MDSHEQALAAVNAAYGQTTPLPTASSPGNHGGPTVWDELGDADLGEGGTERLLFDALAVMVPAARAVVRFLAEQGQRVGYDEVQQHFADHPRYPLTRRTLGGTMTSVKAAVRHVGGDCGPLLRRDEQLRVYVLDPGIAAGLVRVFAVADAHPELLRN